MSPKSRLLLLPLTLGLTSSLPGCALVDAAPAPTQGKVLLRCIDGLSERTVIDPNGVAKPANGLGRGMPDRALVLDFDRKLLHGFSFQDLRLNQVGGDYVAGVGLPADQMTSHMAAGTSGEQVSISGDFRHLDYDARKAFEGGYELRLQARWSCRKAG